MSEEISLWLIAISHSKSNFLWSSMPDRFAVFTQEIYFGIQNKIVIFVTEIKTILIMKAFTLVGVDGNAYSVMGYVQRAMRTANMSKEDQDAYLEDAMSSDYNHLLCVSIDMIEKVNEKLDLVPGDEEDEEDEEDY